MTQTAPFGRTFVIKARRDTVALVAGAVALTFAFSSAIHSHGGRHEAAQPEPQVQQAWAGHLAALSASAKDPAPERLTSESLVVPKMELKLPTMVIRPLVKLRGCEDFACAPHATPPVPARRPAAVATATTAGPAPAHPANPHEKPTVMSRLNPLKHLPDMAAIGKPFSSAGNAVTSWFRSF